ncbi:MAG: hypothetical protein QG596_1693 [Actinomycetota bacterium]|jgi:hypothetical protein|nr:hypothetical protein [Actinomycetota bacterium]
MTERQRAILYLRDLLIEQWLEDDFEAGQRTERLVSQLVAMDDDQYAGIITTEGEA